jgi:hypothetical protein
VTARTNHASAKYPTNLVGPSSSGSCNTSHLITVEKFMDRVKGWKLNL